MSKSKFVFTPDNLISNLDKLGPWSAYGLASQALEHYFPESYKDDISTMEEVGLMKELGFQYWTGVIIKYQAEVGYTAPFIPDFVNEY